MSGQVNASAQASMQLARVFSHPIGPINCIPIGMAVDGAGNAMAGNPAAFTHPV